MSVFYNSLRFHLSYLTMLPPESIGLYGFQKLTENKSGCNRVNCFQGMNNFGRGLTFDTVSRALIKLLFHISCDVFSVYIW